MDIQGKHPAAQRGIVLLAEVPHRRRMVGIGRLVVVAFRRDQRVGTPVVTVGDEGSFGCGVNRRACRRGVCPSLRLDLGPERRIGADQREFAGGLVEACNGVRIQDSDVRERSAAYLVADRPGLFAEVAEAVVV